MAFTLAKTTFSTKADDALAAVDAYMKNDSRVVNIVPDIKDSLNLSSLEGLKGGNFAGDLKGAISAVKKGVSTATKFMNGLDAAKSSIMASLKGLPNAMQARLMQASGLGNITATINGVVSKLKNADVTSLKGLGNLVGAVSGAVYTVKTLTDKNALKALAGNLVREATRVGLTDVYAALDRGLGPGIMNSVTRAILPMASASGSINLLANLAGGSVSGNINAMMPAFKSQFMRQFTLPPLTKVGDYTRVLSSVSDSFGKIDATWNLTSLGGQPAINMNDLNACSRDTSKLFAAQASNTYPAIGTDSDPYAINTSAIPDRLTQMAVLQTTYEKAATAPAKSDPLNRDMEYIGLFGSIKNPNYIPPEAPLSPSPTPYRVEIAGTSTSAGVITSAQKAAQEAAGFNSGAIVFDEPPAPAVSVETSLKKDFPYVYDKRGVMMAGPEFQSRSLGMDFGGSSYEVGGEFRTIKNVQSDIVNWCSTWKSSNEPAEAFMVLYYECLRLLDDPVGAEKNKAKAKAIFAANTAKYTPIVMKLIDEARALGNTDSYVLPTSGPQF